MLIALICIGAVLGGIAALLWWIAVLLKRVWNVITYTLHTYLIVRTQEYATCTPLVEAKIVHCSAWDLPKYLKTEDTNVKVTVTKLD